jgi:hypothetical protein
MKKMTKISSTSFERPQPLRPDAAHEPFPRFRPPLDGLAVAAAAASVSGFRMRLAEASDSGSCESQRLID